MKHLIFQDIVEFDAQKAGGLCCKFFCRSILKCSPVSNTKKINETFKYKYFNYNF